MKNLGILFILFLSLFHPLHSQTSFTLEQAIAYAEEHHLSIQKSRLDIEDAEYQIKEILARAIPTLQGNVDYQRFLQLPTQILPRGSFYEGDPSQGIPPNPEQDLEVQFGVKNALTAGLNFNATVFDGSVFVGIQASRLARELAASQMGITKRDVRDQVYKSYFAVLIALRNQEILQKNVENLKLTLHETREMYQSGFMEKLDVDRLEYSLSNLEMELENVGNLIYSTKNVLKLNMGFPMEDSLEVVESLDEFIDRESSVNLLSENYRFQDRPEALPLMITQELREMDIKQLRFGYLPTLSLFANYNQQLQANKLTEGKWFPSSVVGASLTIPMFDGRDRAMKINRAKVRLNQHLLDVESTQRAFQLEVDNARKDFLNTLNMVSDSEENLDLAQSIYEVAQIKFREGVGSSVEMYQAESTFYQAQSRYINALYDFMISKSNLEKALGKL